MPSISIEAVLAIVGGAVGLISSIVGFLMRSLLQTHREKTEQKYGELGNIIAGLIVQRKECEERELRVILRLDETMEKLRDRWEQFVREDTAMESTRGRKVDALFNVVDHIRDEMRQLRPALLQRIEDLHNRGKVDLRQELRDYVRELFDNTGDVRRPG
jgi:uncharacterized membrane protein YgaE (UPF0421/DUF939 family)